MEEESENDLEANLIPKRRDLVQKIIFWGIIYISAIICLIMILYLIFLKALNST